MLLAGYLTHPRERPEQAGGDFVVAERKANGPDTLVSSAIGAAPYYFTISQDGRFLHGANVFQLCAAAGHAWAWNLDAMSQIALVGHTLGSHTLHPRIFRMPAHSKVTFERGEIRVSPISPQADWRWDEAAARHPFETLQAAFHACLDAGAPTLLSLSAGFDSRLLLALCRSAGIAPTLASMGPPTSTDRKVAALLAAKIGQPLHGNEIEGRDYLTFGEDISLTTSGVKTAGDWHTYLYAKAIAAPDAVHLVGSNGEFARTFFTDAVTRAAVFRIGGRRAAAGYLRLRALNRWRKYPPLLRAQLGPIAAVFRALQLPADAYPRSALACLDTFYATERVRHFIGSGLACFPASAVRARRFLILPGCARSLACRERSKKATAITAAQSKHLRRNCWPRRSIAIPMAAPRSAILRLRTGAKRQTRLRF